jgi:hypothetical protein
MESHLSEESLWASALAARLRVVQANFADDDAAQRQDFLAQEIERALKGCPQEKRKVLLEALALRFPVGQTTVLRTGDGPPTAPAAAETPEALLERLLELTPALSAEQKKSFAARLQQAGLAPERAAGAIELSPELLKRLGLDGSQSFGSERTAKTLALLFDMVLTLDQLVWTLWKQVAPKSVVRKEGDLAKLSGEYLAGSTEVSTAQLQQLLERTRKLVAGLLGAVGRAGSAYARERARIFDSNSIEADARAEKKWNESVEFACWRKYVQLNKEYGAEAAIEKSIQEAMARAAENLIMGRPVG